MTHATSMAAVAAFTLFWYQTRASRSLRQWLLLGLLAGFVATIRWQNVLFALLPACDWVVSAARAVRHDPGASAPGRVLREGLSFLGAAVAGFLPQMLVWQAIYGSPLAVSPVGPEMRLWDPHLVDILFSSRNGLFATSPVLYLAAIGLALTVWRRPGFGVPVALAGAAMWYLNASVQDWWGSASFGMRRFDGLIPVFAVGAAVLFAGIAEGLRRRPQLAAGLATLAFVVWNVTFMQAALSGRFPVGESLSFERLAAEQAAAVERWAGHPFSYPANLLFALRNGLTVSQYDRLGVDRFLGDPARQYGRIDVGTPDDEGVLLLDGWHAAESTATSTYRWASRDAGLLLPLDRSARLLLQVEAQAFHFDGAPQQRLSVVVNDRVFDPVDVAPEWRAVEIDTPADAWRRGINRVRLQFAHGARPLDVGLGGDSRQLSAAVDVIRFRVVE